MTKYPEPEGPPARKSDLWGFRGWNNPARFIQEIDILLWEIKELERKLAEAQKAKS